MVELGRLIQTHWVFILVSFVGSVVTIVGGMCGGFRWIRSLASRSSDRTSVLPVESVVHSAAPARPLQKMKCKFCDGSGHMRIMTGPAEPCIKCLGKGYIFTDRIGQPKCTFCLGHAYRFGATNTLCPVCGGEGLMPWD